MKITFFNLNRLSFEGGAEKYFEEVGITFAKNGHQVHFVGDCRSILNFYVLLGIFLLVNPLEKIFSLLFDLKKSPSMKPGVEKFINHVPLRLNSLIPFSEERKTIKELLGKSDAIFVKNEFLELIFFWLLKIEKSNSSVIIFTPLRYPEGKTLRTRLHNLIYLNKIYKNLIRKFNNIIVSNKEDQRIFKEDFGINEKKIFNIPYGLEKEYFAKEKEFSKNQKFTILFAGRMEEQKGIYYLKKTIENLNKTAKGNEFLFVIAGNGPLQKIPEKLSRSFLNVKYRGHVAPNEMRMLYLSSDLVIMSSKWESFPYVCLEAQTCGVPIVAFDIPGPRDIIECNVTGILVPLGDIQKFESAILYYYNLMKKDYDNYLSTRMLIKEKTYEKFSLEKVVQSLEKIIYKKFD